MKQIKFISSILLLAVMALNAIPSSWMQAHEHKHHHHQACDNSNAALEQNACHISLYHSADEVEKACDHQSHFLEYEAECEACEKLVSQRLVYTYFSLASDLTVASVLIETPSIEAGFVTTETRSQFSRGPPALV